MQNGRTGNKRALFLATALTVALLAISAPVSAQYVVQFDHATGKAVLFANETASPAPLRNGATVRLDPSASIRIKVVNGNTGVYRYSAESREVPVVDAVSGRLGEFLKQFRPYLPEVALAIAGPATTGRDRGAAAPVFRSMLPSAPAPGTPERVANAWRAGRDAELALVVLDDRVHGRHGLQESRAALLYTLESMRLGDDVEKLSAALSDSLGLKERGCTASPVNQSLPLTIDLLSAIQNVLQTRRTLSVATAMAAPELFELESQKSLRDSLSKVAALALSAAADYEDIATAAYDLDHLASIVAHSCSGWSGRAFSAKDIEQKTLAVKVEPRAEITISRVASRGASSFSVTVVSVPRVISALGFSLLAAPDATFPTFSTRAASGGVEIFENSVKDQRFTWGISVGAGWRLSDRLTTRGVRLWIPELTINPQTDTRALGLGSALSAGILKIGVGALWVRHSQLLDQKVGAIIPSKDHLRVADVYERPRLYLSLSVFNTPPFAYGAAK